MPDPWPLPWRVRLLLEWLRCWLQTASDGFEFYRRLIVLLSLPFCSFLVVGYFTGVLSSTAVITIVLMAYGQLLAVIYGNFFIKKEP